MIKRSGEEVRMAARRALALGHAAIHSPTMKRITEARRLVLNVLGAIDDNLCGGEIAELVSALRRMATELTGLQQRTA